MWEGVRPSGVLGGPVRVTTEWAEVNGGITYTERVQGACSLSLLQWYATKHATSASVEQWRASIQAGLMDINGRECRDPDAPIPPNATLVHRRPGWAEPEAPAYLDILWWDPHIVAVHKPSGLQVLPAGPFHERCALTLLRQFHAEHAAELKGMPAPVHRLGRGTSGVLICACSEAARSALSRDLVDHGLENRGRMRKVYRTLVQGLVAADEAEVDVPIGKVAYPGVRGGLYAARLDGGPGAKSSRSRYTVLRRDGATGATLVDVEIFTGRPHQIRIHMAAAGHPLVGDPLYAPGGLPYPAASSSDGQQQQQQRGSADPPPGQPAPAAAAACGVGSAAPAPASGAAGGAADGAAGRTAGGGPEGSSGLDGSAERAVMPGDCGYLLHSMVLGFQHPTSGERIVATCEPPPPLRL